MAEGNDSDDEGGSIAVDVWLSKYGISTKDAVQKAFSERQISIEELIEFDEADLRSFCKELGFDTLTTTRLIKGVKATLKEQQFDVAPAAPSNENNNDDNTLSMPMMDSQIMRQVSGDNIEHEQKNDENVQHIILSPQEHEAMQQMNAQFTLSAKVSKEIETSQNEIDKNTKLAREDCNEKFVLLFEQMKLRQEELLSIIDELSVYKKKALADQSDQLKLFRSEISQCKERYDVLIGDVDLDIHKRKFEIMNMIKSVMSNKVPLSLVTQPQIKMVMPPNAVSTFLSSLNVDNCDRPTAPILIVEKITFDTMTISWQTEFDFNDASMSNRKANEFEIGYAKFEKEFIISKKDMKKEKKKQMKKRRKKKKKKYDSSSSDSDSSESDSDSDSDSDSSSDSSSNSSQSSESDQGFDDEKNEISKGMLMNEGLGDDDDENEDDKFKNIDLSVLNWKYIKKSAKSNSHKIKKLVHGWSYLVRIRGKNESGKGAWSQPIKVSTKTISLVWNQRKHGKGISFIEKNRVKFSKRQAKIAVEYKIKSKTHKIFCWEFKMHKISDYSWIGFMRGGSKPNWNSFLGNNNANEYSIGFGNGSKAVSIQNVSSGNNSQTIPTKNKIRNGDTFRFKANMKNRTVTVYHNKKNIGTLFQNIPSCIVPAASNSSSSMEISCSFAS